jgi:hypothetical protein
LNSGSDGKIKAPNSVRDLDQFQQLRSPLGRFHVWQDLTLHQEVAQMAEEDQ